MLTQSEGVEVKLEGKSVMDITKPLSNFAEDDGALITGQTT